MQPFRKLTGDVVVIGAGVAGCSAFYNLAKLGEKIPGFKPILVDALPPMSLTSANGTFSYRNWFPSEQEAPLRELVTRSIDMMDEISQISNNMIELNRNGYLFVTRDQIKIEEFKSLGQNLERSGGGKFRIHPERQLENYTFSTLKIDYNLDGCDLLLGIDNIKAIFASLKDSNAIAAIHVRRCGSLNPFKLGNYELTKATEFCPQAQIVRGKMTDIFALSGKISGIKVKSDQGESYHISTPSIVLATGPMLDDSLGLLRSKSFTSMNIPILNELHARAVFDDPLQTMSPTSPLTFDSDPIGKFEFTDSEVSTLKKDPHGAEMLQFFPSGVHVRPYANSKMMAIWTYDTAVVEPRYPVEPFLNPKYPEICVRGLTKLFPQIKSYLSDSEVRKSFRVNGGYYCKTLDNMPLIGPAPSTIDGVFMLSAMSGIGLMSSGASGEILARHVLGESQHLEHADAFLPNRFENDKYLKTVSGLSTMGQV